MESNVFLIQASDAESTHDSEADTWAEEPLNFNFYRHNQWHDGERDSDFGKIEVGDKILLYCTGNVDECPKQIKYIYEVSNKHEKRGGGQIGVDNQIDLDIDTKLTRGFDLPLIRKYVDEGKLSEKMNKAGTRGFNLTQVNEKDYQVILDWNEEQEPDVRGIVDILEENLREYIVRSGIECVDEDFEGFELYEDEEGNLGELYRIGVGEIDILYKNPEENKFLVVELKRTEETSDDVVGQISRYIGWVKEEIAEDDEEVQGMIITQSASQRLKYAVIAMDDCLLKEFRLKFQFFDA